MAGSFQSIFKRKNKEILSPPEKAKPLMRVLEPRILLDAAAIETALDIAGQAAHSQLADDYKANSRVVENINENGNSKNITESSLEEKEYADEAELSGDLTSRPTEGEIVFIDAGVENKEELIASLEPGVTVHILDADSDGVQQIADILSDSGGFTAVHIFSHGMAGALQLGNAELNAQSIQGPHSEALKTIGEALVEDGDILIYGCEFGKGEVGQLAAERLAAATGADIAASDDLTGSESLSGDWDLELQTGTIERQAFAAPDWNGILDGYTLAATGQPEIGHLDGGIVGTAGTTALWSNAVVHDPGGGAPLQYYDIQATLIGLSGSTSATFETVASDSPTLDDFRIVLTNIGPVVGSVAGEDVLEQGSAAIRWSILIPGTQTFAPPDAINLVMRDIDGLGGTPDTRDTIFIEPQNISSYTVENGTDLQLSANEDEFMVTGTALGVNDPGSQIGISWDSVNNFVVVYQSRSLLANFDMIGDSALSTFGSPVTVQAQSLDLNGPDGAGSDYLAVYVNGASAGSPEDVPLSIADLDVSIFDLDNTQLFNSTIRLTNVLSGDALNFDTNLLNNLGFNVTFSQVPALPATATEYILQLDGQALISNYLTAIQSITYSNSNIDALFDQVTPRVIEVSITDGIHTTTSTTTIVFGTAGNAPVAGNNIYVEDEDVPIIADASNGLLADDRDRNNDDLDILSVTDSNGVALVNNGLGFLVNPVDGGGASLLTNGATISINIEDGSFSYTPAAYYSGNETFAYVVTDGTNNTQGFATFDIQPIANDVVLSIVAPDPMTDPGTDEDQPSAFISVDAISPDSSETQEFEAVGIPVGVVLTDGTFSFTATQDENSIDISEWDRTQMRVLPVQNSDEEISVVFVVRNFEIDGSFSDASQTVTFRINAIADTPELIVIATQAGIDEDANLSGSIQTTLFDTDGSEILADITISNLPAGSQILVNNMPVTITGGTVVLGPLDIDTLVFRPPAIGTEIIYNLLVTATATEVSPNGTVTLLSATTVQTVLTVDLNDNDQPVVAVDDDAVTFAGETVAIDVLANDFIPDGSPLITHVNGQLIDVPSPVTLAGGEGVVSLSPFGSLVFAASNNFAGEVSFTYTVQDVDLSVDTATVIVKVEPRWVLSSDPVAVEGGNARFEILIEGAVNQGATISTDVFLLDNTATAADHESLTDAITNSIIAFGQDDFSFDGLTLTYTAPDTNYSSVYDLTGSTFFDISATGQALSLGDDSVTQSNLGFDFDFYGNSFSSAFISANGYVTFGSPVVAPDNESLDGSALGGRPVIAPFWDDLNTFGGNVFVETIGTEVGLRQFIIQWEGVTNNSDGSGTASFQVVFNEADGEIRFNYEDVIFDGVGDDGAGATIGLQSASGVSDEFAHNNIGSVVSGSSIVFTRGITVGPTLLIDLAIIDDPEFELNETFSLNLNNSVDSAIGANTALVSIAVSDNTAPVTADDSSTTQETGNTTFNIVDPDSGTTGEAGEDSDQEGHSISISQVEGVVITTDTSVTLASGAIVQVNPNGEITYDPNGAFSYLIEGQIGTDTFTYFAQDSLGDESATPSTVTITIVGENQAPVIDLNDDGTTLLRDLAISYPPTATQINVTAANATVLDPDDTSFVELYISLGGFVQPGNEILYAGGVAIPYGSAAATYLVTIGATVYAVVYDGSDQLNITNNAGGELSAAEVNSFVRAVQYENDSNDDTPGVRTLSFTVDDVDDPGVSSTVSIQVIGNNDAPIAVDDGVVTPFVTAEETSILIPISSLTANDFDIDLGDTFSLVSVQGGPNGSAVLDGSGNVIYTPSQNFFGSTFFTYTIEDSQGATGTASVFVDVTPINDAPEVDLNGIAAGTDFAFVYSENDAPTQIIAASGSVIDVDNTTLMGATISMAGGQVGDILEVGTLPAGILASVVPAIPPSGLLTPGTVVITLTGAASPADYETALRAITFSNTLENPVETDRIISITATDGALSSSVATTTISLLEVNDAPDTLPDGPFSFNEDTIITISPSSLLSNDSDPEGDTLIITSVQSPSNGGTVGFNGVGDIIFAPAGNYFGPATFTYTVEDGNGGVTTETVNLSINSVNDVTVIDLDGMSAGTGFATSYLENAAPIALVDASFSINDVDDTQIESAEIILTNGFIGDVLDITALSGGVTMIVSPAMPLAADGPVILSLSGTASLSVYEDIIRSATFFIASDAPSTVSRTVTITVNDGDDISNVGTSTIAVTAVNDAPIANNDNSIVFDEDTSRIITPAELLANDSDPDLEPFNIVSVQSAINGSVVLNGDGTITFTPVADYFGPASFTYTIDDGNGGQASANVNLTVNSVNDVPTVDLDTATAGTSFAVSYAEDDTVGVPLVDASILLQDVDDTMLESASIVLTDGQVGDLLSVGTLPPGITVTLLPSGGALTSPQQITVTFTGSASPADYQSALQAVSYQSASQAPTLVSATRNVTVVVNDGEDTSLTALTTITVIPSNDVPIVTNDAFSVTEDTSLTIAPGALLSNDVDPDGDILNVVSVANSVNGAVTMVGGQIIFTPNTNFFGPASFEYTVDDGNGGTTVGLVNITVNPVNDAPVLDLDTSSAGNGYLTSYVENDPALQLLDASALLSDVDSPNLTSATFTLSNGRVGDILEIGTLPGSLTANVSPPSALLLDGSITVTLTGIASQADYLLAMQAVTYRSVSEDPDATTRSISVVVSDGVIDSPVATTLISVSVVNDAPVAGPDGIFSFNEDTVFSIPAATLLLNDSDPEGDALSVVSVQGALNGSVVLGGDNIVRFTPDLAYSGPASFTYTVMDANGAVDTQTVSLQVLFLNDAPILDLDSTSGGSEFATSYVENGAGIPIVDSSVNVFDEDHVALVGATVVLTNGRAGDLLEIGLLPGSMSASVVPGTGLNADGIITIILSGNAVLADYEAALLAITFRSTSENPNTSERLIDISVTDGIDPSNVALTRISVTSVNDAPVAIDDGTPTPISVQEDNSISFDPVTGNDFDVEGDVLVINQIDGIAILPGGSVTLLSGGTVDLAADGVTVNFNPPVNYFGPASFDYTITDGSLSDTATVNLNVVSVNDVPIAVDDGPVVLVEDASVVFDPVTANDSDVEGDPLNIVSIDGQAIAANGSVNTANGVITLGADGRTLTFVPDADYFGQSVVAYGLSDGQATSFANVTFDVTPVDDVLLVVSPPSDFTLNDSDIVNLPMAGFINDPDGDALLFSASGLPAGLSINSTTGVIAGVLGSSASQSGPYNVTITVDDGISSIVSFSYDINVLNVVPIASADVVVALDDGANFTISAGAMFVDADGDTLVFSATGLPAWAAINLVSGEISGTVPTDASVFGTQVVSVSVDDGEGGTASVDVTLDPRNLAPISVGSINDLVLRDSDEIDLDISSLFVDGGTDDDMLVLSVSGLPDGFVFDPVANRITGIASTEIASIAPYVITITADDGQGGTVTQTFEIRVTQESFIEESPFVDNPVITVDPETGDFDPVQGQIDITSLVSGISELNSTTALDSKSGILLSAVNAIEPLYEATSAGSDGGLPEQIAAMGQMASSTDWLNASGREGNGDWNVSGTFGYQSLMDEKNERDLLGMDDRLERISLEINSREGVLFIEFKNELRPEQDGKVVKTILLLPDGKPLPEWMKLIREGFISAKPPAGEKEVILELTVILGNGNELIKTMRVDLVSGEATTVDKTTIDVIAEKIKEFENNKVEFELKDLRGPMSVQNSST